jgi:hypothetical protein
MEGDMKKSPLNLTIQERLNLEVAYKSAQEKLRLLTLYEFTEALMHREVQSKIIERIEQYRRL